MDQLRRKIIRNNFLTLNGITFSFRMTDHLNPQQNVNDTLTAICTTIANAYQANFPIWARLLRGHRIFLITPQHGLFQYLDEESRSRVFNWLIFNRQGNHITVTHFGPFGRKKDEEFEDLCDQTDSALAILKRQWNALKSLDNKMPEEEKQKEQERIIGELLKNFWAILSKIESEIKSKKEEVKSFISRVFDSPEVRADVDELIEKLMASTGKVMIKMIMAKITPKVLEKIALKAAAKIAAKTVAKKAAIAAGKSAAKKVPFIGAVVGFGLGAWRLANGDKAGAALEVSSGAASCFPGAGTAASFALDAALVAKDIAEATAEINRHAEELKAEMKKVEMELNDLGEQYDKAKEDYEFAKEVLEDSGFEIGKLQREIAILEEISTALHKV